VIMDCVNPLKIFTGGYDAPWADVGPWAEEWCRAWMNCSLIITPLGT